jgi:hypothetical protein
MEVVKTCFIFKFVRFKYESAKIGFPTASMGIPNHSYCVGLARSNGNLNGEKSTCIIGTLTEKWNF